MADPPTSSRRAWPARPWRPSPRRPTQHRWRLISPSPSRPRAPETGSPGWPMPRRATRATPASQAVVYAILNRLADGRWGASVDAVLNARSQFEPVMTAGGDWRRLPPVSAAQQAHVDAILNLILDGASLTSPTAHATSRTQDRGRTRARRDGLAAARQLRRGKPLGGHWRAQLLRRNGQRGGGWGRPCPSRRAGFGDLDVRGREPRPCRLRPPRGPGACGVHPAPSRALTGDPAQAMFIGPTARSGRPSPKRGGSRPGLCRRSRDRFSRGATAPPRPWPTAP